MGNALDSTDEARKGIAFFGAARISGVGMDTDERR